MTWEDLCLLIATQCLIVHVKDRTCCTTITDAIMRTSWTTVNVNIIEWYEASVIWFMIPLI